MGCKAADAPPQAGVHRGLAVTAAAHLPSSASCALRIAAQLLNARCFSAAAASRQHSYAPGTHMRGLGHRPALLQCRHKQPACDAAGPRAGVPRCYQAANVFYACARAAARERHCQVTSLNVAPVVAQQHELCVQGR
jgi:hypothetical protein